MNHLTYTSPSAPSSGHWCLTFKSLLSKMSISNRYMSVVGGLIGLCLLVFCLAESLSQGAFASESTKTLAQTSTNNEALLAQAAKPEHPQKVTIKLAKGLDLELLYCKPGSFTMGSPKGEFGRSEDETQHKVTLTKGFYLGKYEVTQEQYYAVMHKNPSSFTGNKKRPVDQVSWHDAQEFCKKLNATAKKQLPLGYQFALPSEAQWEYACRATTKTALNNGADLKREAEAKSALRQVGWYDYNSGDVTRPVGQKKPNSWGFYDMHGNVSEWCNDVIDSYGGDISDPTGAADGRVRALRGGSWRDEASFCRSACRGGYNPEDAYIFVGFRLAALPTP